MVVVIAPHGQVFRIGCRTTTRQTDYVSAISALLLIVIAAAYGRRQRKRTGLHPSGEGRSISLQAPVCYWSSLSGSSLLRER
jgi:hypothetical protein